MQHILISDLTENKLFIELKLNHLVSNRCSSIFPGEIKYHADRLTSTKEELSTDIKDMELCLEYAKFYAERQDNMRKGKHCAGLNPFENAGFALFFEIEKLCSNPNTATWERTQSIEAFRLTCRAMHYKTTESAQALQAHAEKLRDQHKKWHKPAAIMLGIVSAVICIAAIAVFCLIPGGQPVGVYIAIALGFELGGMGMVVGFAGYQRQKIHARLSTLAPKLFDVKNALPPQTLEDQKLPVEELPKPEF